MRQLRYEYSKRPPRWPQEGPQGLQEGPKRGPSGRQKNPKIWLSASRSPRGPQECPKRPARGPHEYLYLSCLIIFVYFSLYFSLDMRSHGLSLRTSSSYSIDVVRPLFGSSRLWHGADTDALASASGVERYLHRAFGIRSITRATQ